MPRHFITPTRLYRNPRLAQSIELTVTLKPERKKDIFLPEATVRWLKSNVPNNWTTISAENAAACIKWRESDLEFPWEYDIPKSQKILDLVIKIPDKRHIALRSSFLREETLTLFIEQELAQMAEQEAKKRVEYSGSWRRIPHIFDIDSITSRILQNRSCKTYQIELLWHKVHPHVNVAERIVEFADVHKIPDYMLKDLSKGVLERKDDRYRGYDSYAAEMRYVIEAYRRGLLAEGTPALVQVASQPRPATFEEATTPTN